MKNLTLSSFLFLLLTACSSQRPAALSEFPLEKGTTWVYSYKAYEPSPSDPFQTIQSVYQLTETIVETKTAAPYFVAHVKRDYQLINADPGWTGDFASSQPADSWYILDEDKLFESMQPIDLNHITTDQSSLAYDFPLSLGESWCYLQPDQANPKGITNCDFVGKRMVTNSGAYQIPAGKFDNCYELTDYFNGGNIIHWFCKGVGIVFMKFDHAGTKFGFEQTLTSYSR